MLTTKELIAYLQTLPEDTKVKHLVVVCHRDGVSETVSDVKISDFCFRNLQNGSTEVTISTTHWG